MSVDDPLLTVREVADAMRVSHMTVYRLIKSGALAAIRVGRNFRIRASELEAYLESQTVTVTAGFDDGGDGADGGDR